MYINITDSETGGNKGSCGQLVNYLEKENHSLGKGNYPPEQWFNNSRTDILPQEVRINIDNNIAKLGKSDAKFFLVNISPSQKEIAHLKQMFGSREGEQKLKEYAGIVMDTYARNFKRAGVNSGQDLLWYGKLEHHRYYSDKDKEVKEGLKKRGERKEGEQMHVQVIVSRKDITNSIKLSPLNNSSGKNREHSEKMGQFDRKAFKGSGEQLFDQMFHFERSLKETMAYANTMKNGSAEQKRLCYVLEQAEERLTNEVNNVLYHATTFQQDADNMGLMELLPFGGDILSGLLSTLLSHDHVNSQQSDGMVPERKKKKRKGPSGEQSGGLRR
jgi:hypothetical protein